MRGAILIAAALALFMGNADARPLGGTANTCGSTFNDGCGGAPSGTPQFPSLLSGYATRPVWKVAGVDYAVGPASGITVFGSSAASPTQGQINLASTGATISGSTVTLTGANPSLGSAAIGFVFANGTTITVNGAATGAATIQNVTLNNASTNSWQGISVANNAVVDLTVTECEVNGGKYSGDVTGQSLDTGIYYGGKGVFTATYDYLHGLPIDVFQVQTGSPQSFNIQYNLVNGMGYSPSGGGAGHPDTLQLLGSTVTGTFAFNTVVNPNDGAGQGGDNPLLDVEAQSVGSTATVNNIIYANNVLISQGTTLAPTNSLTTGSFIDDVSSRLNGFSFIYNFVDPSGVKFFPPYFGTSAQLQTTGNSINLWEGNKLLTTGASSNPTTVGSVAAGTTTNLSESPSTQDITGIGATPPSGTVNPGSGITFVWTSVRPLTVTGTPTLTLSNGASATYASGSGTANLIFTYEVGAGDTPISNLAITGSTGAIKDQFGNAANLSAAFVTFTGLNVN